MKTTDIQAAEGRLGILVVGCGAVATTMMTGVLMARKGLTTLIGSMTQMDKIRVGRGADRQYLPYRDIVPLACLDDIVFAVGGQSQFLRVDFLLRYVCCKDAFYIL